MLSQNRIKINHTLSKYILNSINNSIDKKCKLLSEKEKMKNLYNYNNNNNIVSNNIVSNTNNIVSNTNNIVSNTNISGMIFFLSSSILYFFFNK